MARLKNPRRVVLELLRELVKATQFTIKTWNVTGEIFDPAASPRHWRKRRTEEYPEHQRHAWAALVRRAEAMEIAAQQLRDFAAHQIDLIDTNTTGGQCHKCGGSSASNITGPENNPNSWCGPTYCHWSVSN